MSAAATHAEFMVRDSRQPGHFWADNEILDIYGAKLGAHGIAVYMAMTRRADNSTGECTMSTRRIAVQVGMSTGGVFNALLLICSLSLARKVLEAEHGRPAVYVLADVKALRCSSGEHQCSSGERGVHPVNTQYGKKDFLKTKPNPPNPPFQGGNGAHDLEAKPKRLTRAEKRALAEKNYGKPCPMHPESGLTQWGTCWACYSATHSSAAQQA
jgi:hypothetical protein